MLSNEELQKIMKEQFEKQPLPVQKAIKSADLEKRMRDLAGEHNLLLDKWQLLENQVTLTLLGFQEASELAENIENEVEVPKETAEALATAIAQQIFDPIRKELERALENPDTTDEPETPQTAAAGEAAETASPATSATPTPSTATEQKETAATPEEPAQPAVKRGTLLDSYKSGALSAERKQIEGDPYRESAD